MKHGHARKLYQLMVPYQLDGLAIQWQVVVLLILQLILRIRIEQVILTELLCLVGWDYMSKYHYVLAIT